VKKSYTLHVLKMNDGDNVDYYVVTRHTGDCPGGGMLQAAPQSWERLSHVLDLLGSDQFKIAALKRTLDTMGSDSILEAELDEAGLRLIGFTDV
jgi:hypothetical protein